MSTGNDEKTRAWDRQPGEPEKAYAHFTKWLALADRNLAKAAKPLRLSHGRLLDLSSDYGWQARAAAYDQHEAQQIAEATAKDRLAAARALARDIRESAEARLGTDPEERDAQVTQRLAAALKSITPALDQPIAVATASVDIEGLYAAVRAREEQVEEDESEEA